MLQRRNAMLIDKQKILHTSKLLVLTDEKPDTVLRMLSVSTIMVNCPNRSTSVEDAKNRWPRDDRILLK